MSLFADLGGEVLQRIQEINSLDMELYRYALSLLHQRADQWRTRDPHFQVLLPVNWHLYWDWYWYTGTISGSGSGTDTRTGTGGGGVM